MFNVRIIYNGIKLDVTGSLYKADYITGTPMELEIDTIKYKGNNVTDLVFALRSDTEDIEQRIINEVEKQ